MKTIEAEETTAAASQAQLDATTAKPVHFTIDVALEKDSDGKQYTVPLNIPQFMHPGDTARYKSPDGAVTVKFNKDSTTPPPPVIHTSPYTDTAGNDLQTVTSGVTLKVTNIGTYFGMCSITLPSGVEIGWQEKASAVAAGESDESDESGGNHVVKNP
jgi:hypothetical protein